MGSEENRSPRVPQTARGPPSARAAAAAPTDRHSAAAAPATATAAAAATVERATTAPADLGPNSRMAPAPEPSAREAAAARLMRDCYLRESEGQSADALGRQELPFWADARGAPLVRRGFSLRTPPLGRLDAGARVQVRRACQIRAPALA